MKSLSLESFTTFGDLLRYLRQREKLTQRELSIAVGYSESQINRLEHNSRLPEVSVIASQFIPALHLGDEPDTASRLLELAAQARGESALASLHFVHPTRSEAMEAGAPLQQRCTNLPAQLTRFIGREDEIAELAARAKTTRLLTLTGAGGVGKTRLALEVASRLVEATDSIAPRPSALTAFRDGVWLVEFAPITDETLVTQTVAVALGVTERPAISLEDLLLARIRDWRTLLIFDNCEHLVVACAALAERLLRACPDLHILATSREPLHIAGEVTWRVPSLTDEEAVQLFVERARANQPKFEVTTHNAIAISQICHRLDGIPLAIELAAGRANTLSVEQIARRLDDRFGLLTSGSRTALPRHKTLRATIAWSVDLLTPPERELLWQLSVFAGGFTAEAAEAVSAQPNAFDLLSGLVDKSLVIADVRDEAARYRLLETICEYAREQLATAGEVEVAGERHLDYFRNLAEEIEPQPQLHSGQSIEGLDKLEQEHDNLRAALNWAIEHGKNDSALRLSGALGPFWEVHGYWNEGQGWLEWVLTLSYDLGSSSARRGWYAQALLQAGYLVWRQCNYGMAREFLERSLVLHRDLGDQSSLASAFSVLGGVSYEQGDYALAQTAYEEELALRRELGDKTGIAYSLTNLALVRFNQGDLAAARRLCEESVPLHREMRDKYGISYALNLLGNILSVQGDPVAAQTAYEEGLALRRELGNKRGIAATLDDLGNLRTKLGDYDAARAQYEESLSLFRELGNHRGMAGALSGFARIALLTGQPQPATRLFGAVETLLTQINATLDEPAHSDNERAVTILHSQLDETSFNIAWKEGRSMRLEQAVALALSI